MITAIKAKLYPTKAQRRLLESFIEQSRRTYNLALEQRIHGRRVGGKALTLYDQCADLTRRRAVEAAVREIPLDVSRDGLRRVETAFQRFWKKNKAGKRAGFPRFKSISRYNSVTFTFPSKTAQLQTRVRIPGIKTGIRTRGLRDIPGTCKRITVKRTGSDWYVVLLLETGVAAPEKCAVKTAVGVDVGLKSFATLSNAQAIENPRFGRKQAKRLATLQRALSRKKKGSGRRQKAKNKCRQLHAKISNQRENFLHHTSKWLVSNYDLIAVEKLNIRGMVRSRFAKSISDASWGNFKHMLAYKAERAGKTVVEVNPRNTSQECSGCGSIVRKELSEHHNCPGCGLKLDRDVNAARVVLARALNELGLTPRTVGTSMHAESVTAAGFVLKPVSELVEACGAA